MDLVNQLTQNLGITDKQARGGAGLILRMAQDNLGPKEFTQVSDSIPGIDKLIKAAPEVSTTRKAVEGLTSAIGGSKQALNMTGLVDGFSKLGLDSQMVSRFVPIVLSFVQARGGNTTRTILEKILLQR